MANSHPGSYCGQDAYNDMLVTENEDIFTAKNRRVQTIRQSKDNCTQRLQECNGSNSEGGTTWKQQ